jgi:hypothetical protein
MPAHRLHPDQSLGTNGAGAETGRSYPKLGVAGRHQLRDVIARAGTSASADEDAESDASL